MDTLDLDSLSGPAVSAGIPTAAAASNLLRWTEEFDNAVWSKLSATVTANAANDPNDDQLTAEEVVFASGGAIRQSSQVAATAGLAASQIFTPSAAWQRFQVSGAFDGLDYTFSIYALDATGASLRLRLDRFAGFLRCSVESPDGSTVLLDWAQLEQAAAATSYVMRTN